MKKYMLFVVTIIMMCDLAKGVSPGTNSTSVDEPTQGKSEQQVQYRLLEEPYGYELIWRPRQLNVWPDDELIRLSQGDERPQSGPWVFNWVARRDPIFLVSGDLPRFAMMRTYRTPEINPPYAKLGDLRIRLTIDGVAHWLDEVDPIEARFFAWGTIHEATLGNNPECSVRVVSTLVQNRGIGIKVELETDSDEATEILLELFYGGLSVKEPHLLSSYIKADSTDSQNDLVGIRGEAGHITSPLQLSSSDGISDTRDEVPVSVKVITSSLGAVEVTLPESGEETSNRLVWRHRIDGINRPQSFCLIAIPIDSDFSSERQADIHIDRFDEYLAQTQEYYAHFLNSVAIQTPDPFLDSAFSAAAINLEYSYQPPGWLEGLHKWNSYLVNNYQISAAICMGQLERARDALLLIGDRPEGPGPNLMSDGSVFMHANHQFEEGLIYFILQLHRYWQATHDMESLDGLWDGTVNNLEKMLSVRDPDGNTLINWHQGCNMFLYQADHLSLPGDASSPSIMAADILKRMAEMADARGEGHLSARWRRRAEHMQSEILRRLWNSGEGKFTAAIDTQGNRMAANYYTDFVYPQLYSDLPAEYAWISLKTLDSTLWTDEGLMRTGNYMPPLFGNNQVHPLQMAEAAEAYFQAGRATEGAQLLHGVARAATVRTDSPGSFPERMSDSGFGQPDYCFGNPAGSYVRAVVGGLFGLERAATKQALQWRPAIPADWNSASLRVDDIKMEVRGLHGSRIHRVQLAGKEQAIDLRIPLYGHQVEKVLDAQGQELPHTQVPHPGGGFLELRLPSAAVHTVQLVSSDPETVLSIPANVKSGESVVWKLPEERMAINDLQSVFAEFRISGDTLTGVLGIAEQSKHLFLVNQTKDRVIPIELDFGSRPQLVGPTIVVKGKRESLLLDEQFNSDSIEGYNFWAGGSKVDLTHSVTQDTSGPNLKVGRFSFRVKPSGKNLIQLIIGGLSHYDLLLEHVPEKPQSVFLPVEKKVKCVEFLMACDFKIRLTDMQIGSLVFHYEDGYQQTEPLIYGHNVDCFIKPFATGVDSYELSWLAHLGAFSILTDSTRILERIEVRLDATDGNIGILAANVVLPGVKCQNALTSE